MGRTALGGGSKAWSDGEKWIARYLGYREETFGQGKKARVSYVLQFSRDGVEVMERWATAFWERQILGDKERKMPPTLKPGAVLEVSVQGEQKLKGGKRFRPFLADVLSGDDIPKAFRRKS